ncbi:MAG TPA: hypothetical protein VFG95_10025, partial [Nitrospiria bacterium]|nr:hypothetical protein [Nitrospiria bacterium]
VPLLLLSAEIAITLIDFTIEVETRKSLGGLYDGERITHAVIAIFFGAMLATFIPALLKGWRFPSTFALIPENDVDPLLRPAFFLMAIGAILSSARDFFAASGLPYSHWPWSIKTIEGNDVDG